MQGLLASPINKSLKNPKGEYFGYKIQTLLDCAPRPVYLLYLISPATITICLELDDAAGEAVGFPGITGSYPCLKTTH
jgi:hypothetical protein